MSRILHWFRNDLRLEDNSSLYYAFEHSDSAPLCCFLSSSKQWATHDLSPFRHDLMMQQLDLLQDELSRLGSRLIVLESGSYAQQIQDITVLMKEHGCTTLCHNAEYGFNERKRDQSIADLVQKMGLAYHCFPDQSILPAGRVLKKDGDPYTVFTPYSRRWREIASSSAPLPLKAPGRVAYKAIPNPPKASGISHYPRQNCGLKAGETNAHQQLNTFLEERVFNYHKARDLPAVDGTSRLSPYLASGILSGRQCWHALRNLRQAVKPTDEEALKGIVTWESELIWRDFYIDILLHFPRVSRHQPFKLETSALPWRTDAHALQRWREGSTGVPIVDAAMRQLAASGWMHNRLRMICAMFLSKNLFLDWRLGESWFMRSLVDGYLPSNNGGWQWSASTGNDAAPYFRIFNPVSQSQRFDAAGSFIRHWVPELRSRNEREIHLAMDDPPEADYPAAMVDLKSSRKEAIEAFKSLRGQASPPEK